jgi:hypothetical protein
MSLPARFPEGPGHALDRVAAALDSYLGVTCDLIHLAIFVSLASGCMATPIPLDIASNSLTADLMRCLSSVLTRFVEQLTDLKDCGPRPVRDAEPQARVERQQERFGP